MYVYKAKWLTKKASVQAAMVARRGNLGLTPRPSSSPGLPKSRGSLRYYSFHNYISSRSSSLWRLCFLRPPHSVNFLLLPPLRLRLHPRRSPPLAPRAPQAYRARNHLSQPHAITPTKASRQSSLIYYRQDDENMVYGTSWNTQRVLR